MRRTIGTWMMALALGACGGAGGNDGGDGDSADGGALPNGEGPCEAASDCEGDVCVALVDGDKPPIYCTQVCGSGCPEGFYCDGSTFALVGLDFCRLGDPPGSEEPPPTSEEPPRLPCREDADCEDGQVCATYMGERDCTIACSVEEDCTPPAVGGITFDFATCGADETPGQERTVCLPDLDCYPNAQSCIQGFPGGF